jgi:PTH2 family peptidyl-tRNA hydrolase
MDRFRVYNRTCILENMKQVIVVRGDLELSKGKIAAQACHASLAVWKLTDKVSKAKWELGGEKVVVLKCKDLNELMDLKKKAKALRISYAIVKDAGHTEVEPGTITALGLGPDSDMTLDKVTGHLKMI